MASLAHELSRAIRGEVRFDAAHRALYSTDASNYRQVPIGVIFPADAEDVLKALAVCREFDVPVLSRGAGTSLAGQTCNTAVIFDFSRHMNRILSIDPVKRIAEVEPGVILDHLRNAAETFGLTFGPDPATHSRCTLGGMIGNNSCGVHSIMSGKTSDNVESLDVVTYDGLRFEAGAMSEAQIRDTLARGGRLGELVSSLHALAGSEAERIRAKFPRIPRRVSGFNLDELLPERGFHLGRALVGSEGTCAIVLKARVKLVPSPSVRRLLALGYPDIYEAAADAPRIMTSAPIGLEGMDLDIVSNLGRYTGYAERIRLLPQGNAWLLVEMGGASAAEAEGKTYSLLSRIQRMDKPDTFRLCRDAAETKILWSIRESVLSATAFIPGAGDRHEGWEDTAVPPEKLASYLRELRALYGRYGYKGAFYGHFGDGCLHTRIDFDLESEDGRATMRRFLDDAADLVVRYGGSLSGEHGDGQARAELLPKMFGPELIEAFRTFKRAWDPRNRMNPGKVIDAFGIFDNLRSLRRDDGFTKTHFSYPKQERSFVRAVLRCVGVGKCRNEWKGNGEGGMCPSYQVTRDEQHSTRGRAHLLFEMLKGETITGGWRSREIKDALDLCLACKACKSDCPTNVDMASWKAEFLSHFYAWRLRPLKAYVFGFVHWGARLGSIAPKLSNALLKHVKPDAPRFASETFRNWFGEGRREKREERKENPSSLNSPPSSVVLWADTFNNHFTPGPAKAATEVLCALGYSVRLPPKGLCCGRPLYDQGLLGQAKRQLRQILRAMRSDIEAGTPIVVLEPGCASVFRDELLNFFPDDPLAQKLCGQVKLLSEFLVDSPLTRPSGTLSPGERGEKAILQIHCHHRSVMDWNSEVELLKRLGIEAVIPESSCCGMAGAFGMERSHQSVSQSLAERVLAPAIREAPPEALIIADGFSCREQIRRTTGRPALHLAEVLNLARKQGSEEARREEGG